MGIRESAFSVDDFKNPKIYKNAEAIATLLTRLLLLEPGTIQSHPEMGVGLMSRYRYGVEGSASDLQANYQRQIETYLPDFSGARVSVKQVRKEYQISVKLEHEIFHIFYDAEKQSIKKGYARLSSL